MTKFAISDGAFSNHSMAAGKANDRAGNYPRIQLKAWPVATGDSYIETEAQRFHIYRCQHANLHSDANGDSAWKRLQFHAYGVEDRFGDG